MGMMVQKTRMYKRNFYSVITLLKVNKTSWTRGSPSYGRISNQFRSNIRQLGRALSAQDSHDSTFAAVFIYHSVKVGFNIVLPDLKITEIGHFDFNSCKLSFFGGLTICPRSSFFL